MEIKEVRAFSIKDSRKEKTISIIIKTKKKFKTSAPSGKSKGKYEKKPYIKNINHDINFINNLNIKKLNELFNKIKNWKEFSLSLIKLEKILNNKIGANSLFALEASLLKSVAEENNKNLFEFLKGNKIPRPVGNAVGGGLHSKGNKKPEFQEFLFIGKGKTFKESVKINNKAYKLIGRLLNAKKRNDEGAWETSLNNEEILFLMNQIRKKYSLDIGLDIASSSFYKKTYNYKNKKLNKKQQIDYILKLIKKYNLFYIEDPLNENDFSGFSDILKKSNSLIVGDDLTTTNPQRLKKAIKNKSINAIIIKPNQIGSLLKMKQCIDIAKKHNLKTIISHRSGETLDNTISDLCVGFNCDFIKTGIYSKYRKSKLKRLIKIEKLL